MNMCLKFCIMTILVALGSLPLSAQDHWPQFRGTQAAGVGTGNPPLVWNVETGENIRWQIPIKGLAHSSPIAYGDRIFLTTAISHETDAPKLDTGWLDGSGDSAEDSGEWSWQVICIDLKSGEPLWEKTVAKGKPTVQRHLKATHANCTAATDGKFVVAFFGSEGLFCLDFDGNLIWEKDFGLLRSGPGNEKALEWGFSSSPVIHDDKVVVQCDCSNTGFVAVLELASGKEILRFDRTDGSTWSTPTIVQTNDLTQIVCNGYQQMAGYDFNTGELRWSLSGGGDVPVPTPLFAHGRIYLTNGHGRSRTYAVLPDAIGNLTPDEESDELPDGLDWWQPRGGSYMPTPIIVGEFLYTCNDNGILTVVDAKTGDRIYRKRMGVKTGTYSASAIATENQLYFSAEQGVVHVVKTGSEFELLASNDMKDILMSTPAMAGDLLLIRTARTLFCVGKPTE